MTQGARTAWHMHPLDQTLIVKGGWGWVQREGGRTEQIRPGDMVWLSPGEKRWYRAMATAAMAHYCYSRKEGRQGRGVDGKGERQAIPASIKTRMM